MSTKRKFFVGMAASVALLGAIWWASPLRRPDAAVRAWVLRQTPLGSSLPDVERVVRGRGWYSSHRVGGGGAGPWEFRWLIFAENLVVTRGCPGEPM